MLDSFLDKEQQPDEILEKCRLIDAGYIYEEIQEIKGQKDIDNLDWASGGFHDARIAKEELQQDGTLYLRFDGTWGCEVEVWLWGIWIMTLQAETPNILTRIGMVLLFFKRTTSYILLTKMI